MYLRKRKYCDDKLKATVIFLLSISNGLFSLFGHSDLEYKCAYTSNLGLARDGHQKCKNAAPEFLNEYVIATPKKSSRNHFALRKAR